MGFCYLFFLILVSTLVMRFLYSESTKEILVFFGIVVLVFGFVLHLLFTTEYTILGGVLKIKSGFVYKKELAIKDIKSISKTNNLISSPAASFDRIELRYGQFSSVIISPKDKMGFAKELTRINPEIINKL